MHFIDRKDMAIMFPTELDDYPTLSSSISFTLILKSITVDMTVPHKQEQEHRLRHIHTTHCIQMWVPHFIVEIKNCLPSMLTHGPLYFIHTTHLYSSSTVTVPQNRNSFPATPLHNNYQPGQNTSYGHQN